MIFFDFTLIYRNIHTSQNCKIELLLKKIGWHVQYLILDTSFTDKDTNQENFYSSGYRSFPNSTDGNGHRIWIVQVKVHRLKDALLWMPVKYNTYS